MLNRIFQRVAARRMARFERQFSYDMSYGHHILAASPTAFRAFAGVFGLASYREDVPTEAWYAAKLATAVIEDCGPCVQLTVRMAEAAGVSGRVLTAILKDDDETLPADVRLGMRFARAVMAHAAEADDLRQQVLARWGQKGLISLSFGIVVSRMYPTLKYALGHGQACQRVHVTGLATPIAPHVPLTALPA